MARLGKAKGEAMKVKEFLEKLSNFDPEVEVVVVLHEVGEVKKVEAVFYEGPDADMGGLSDYFEIKLGGKTLERQTR